MALLKRVNAGDPIRASDINQIIEYVENRLRVSVGQGLSASWAEGGLLLALAARQDYLVPAVVLDNGGNTPRIANDVRYTVRGIGSPGVVLDNVLPAFGRPVKDEEAGFTKVRPAKVGAFCFVVRQPTDSGTPEAKLWILAGGTDGETIYARRCTVTP